VSLIVTQYLDFAELQALERRPMTMRDWLAKLDAFLRAGDREILEDAGGISARRRSGRRNWNLTSSRCAAASWRMPEQKPGSRRKSRT